MSSLTKLRELWLTNNRFSGRNAKRFCSTQQKKLKPNVSTNRFHSMSIFSCFLLLPSCLLSTCLLQKKKQPKTHNLGDIHFSLGNMRSLTHLCLHSNKLSGRIPSCIRYLHNLRVLLLGDNQLDGEIPQEIKSLFLLTHLSLHNNQLTGKNSMN